MCPDKGHPKSPAQEKVIDNEGNVGNVDNVSNIWQKYIVRLTLEIDTHRHFKTSNRISEPVRIFFKKHIIFICTIFLIYIYIYIY